MQKKKKLLHIVEAMGGGIFTYIVDLSNRLCDEYDIYVAYGVREQTPDDIESYFDNRIHLIKVENFTREIKLNKDIPAIFEVRKLVKKIKPDIIHLHSSKAGVIGRVFVGGKSKKFYTPHGYSFLMYDVGAIKKAFYFVMEKISGLSKCTTIACGPGEYEESKKLTKRATCISNGIDIESVEKDIVKHINDIDENKTTSDNESEDIKQISKEKSFTVATLGRICEQKNPVEFNKIAVSMPDVRFIWIGAGELEHTLTAPNVEITGWLKREDALSTVLKADAFMLTSLWEGLPISLLEAMYLKKVCVVSNVIGNKDVINNKVNGYICNNVEEYVQALTEIKDKNNIETITQNAYTDVLDKYNSNLIAQKYKDLYESK